MSKFVVGKMVLADARVHGLDDFEMEKSLFVLIFRPAACRFRSCRRSHRLHNRQEGCIQDQRRP